MHVQVKIYKRLNIDPSDNWSFTLPYGYSFRYRYCCMTEVILSLMVLRKPSWDVLSVIFRPWKANYLNLLASSHIHFKTYNDHFSIQLPLKVSPVTGETETSYPQTAKAPVPYSQSEILAYCSSTYSYWIGIEMIWILPIPAFTLTPFNIHRTMVCDFLSVNHLWNSGSNCTHTSTHMIISAVLLVYSTVVSVIQVFP